MAIQRNSLRGRAARPVVDPEGDDDVVTTRTAPPVQVPEPDPAPAPRRAAGRSVQRVTAPPSAAAVDEVDPDAGDVTLRVSDTATRERKNISFYLPVDVYERYLSAHWYAARESGEPLSMAEDVERMLEERAMEWEDRYNNGRRFRLIRRGKGRRGRRPR